MAGPDGAVGGLGGSAGGRTLMHNVGSHRENFARTTMIWLCQRVVAEGERQNLFTVDIVQSIYLHTGWSKDECFNVLSEVQQAAEGIVSHPEHLYWSSVCAYAEAVGLDVQVGVRWR